MDTPTHTDGHIKGEGGAGGREGAGPPHKNARPQGRTPLCPNGALWEGEREGEREGEGPSQHSRHVAGRGRAFRYQRPTNEHPTSIHGPHNRHYGHP